MELFIAMIPIILTIIAIFTTRNVKIALPVGIISAAFFANNGHFVHSIGQIFESFVEIFYDATTDLKINTWNVPIMIFLILIGVFASISRYIGASRAFTNKLSGVVKTKRGAKLMTAIVGNSLFFDDYFNSLVTGEITKPVNNKHKVTAAEMSYILDSCAGPSAGLMIISTWGAFLVGIIGTELVGTSFDYMSAVEVFLKTVPLQLYSILAIVGVYLVIFFNIKIAKMRKVVDHFDKTGTDLSSSTSGRTIKPKDFGVSTISLILPIVSLLVTTLFVMFYDSGYQINLMMQQDITMPLMFGGLSASIMSIWYSRFYGVSWNEIKNVSKKGKDEMMGAITILIMAWMLASNVGTLDIGLKIEEAFKSSIDSGNFPTMWIPVLVFITALFIAFSTGSSWGSFGIMIPISIPLADAIGTEAMLFALIGASISGSILGDHSSPISDTTLLAATGSKCKLQSHFETQVPYAMIIGAISAIGYMVFGFTSSLIMTYIASAVILSLLIVVYRVWNNKKEA